MSTDLWGTPQAFFDKLNHEFNFVLDVCALSTNAKCDQYLTPEMDALTYEWRAVTMFPTNIIPSIWMNPPYGKGISAWVQKAWETGKHDRLVALLPVRSNAPWWHDYVMKASEIRFVRHKVKFEGPVKGVPFWGVAIVIFSPEHPYRKTPVFSTFLQPQHEAKHLSQEVLVFA